MILKVDAQKLHDAFHHLEKAIGNFHQVINEFEKTLQKVKQEIMLAIQTNNKGN